MSAFGGKADVIQGVAECPLIAISGHSTWRGFHQQISPIMGQIVIYRTNLGPDWCWYALCTAIVGNRGKPFGESRLIPDLVPLWRTVRPP